MKTVLATFILAALAVIPATAFETSYALRGAGTAAPAQATAKAGEPAPVAEAAPVKKVRVVLASPYGN